VWRKDGVPNNVPLMITEDHVAANLTGPMSTIFAGLWLADNVGSFFEGGGALFTHSPIQPQTLQNSCLGWASWSNFVADEEYNITGYTSLFFAAQMINREWVQHRSGVHGMFPSSLDIKDGGGTNWSRPTPYTTQMGIGRSCWSTGTNRLRIPSASLSKIPLTNE